MVTEESVSRLHRLSSDELWIFQGGLPLELVTISPDGELQTRVLGDLEEIVRSRDHGCAPTAEFPVGLPAGSADWLLQALVPAGSWQGARLAGGPHLPADLRLGARELRRHARLRLRRLRDGRARGAAGGVSAARGGRRAR